ncbi:peptidyl-prolyl cis-trans isomerase C [Formivibrio citricus]|uniref:peptidylprolyl isomerase n=1 Tax=Formivibrio citricus TaxID=83765 RepID=A0A1I4YYZ5_9NEIS|nr:nitrogen fixation protein NifM [Formivibrio citricus]SFN43235.1 peptidyl-prolyl cis-trans isomerase C [Formivibrio citricus]
MQTLAYLEFQTAQAHHGKPVAQLSTAEKQAVHQEAVRQWQLEEKILATPEALACIVEPASQDDALTTLRNRYPDRGSFLADLAANGMNETLLKEALARELRVDAVLTLVAARAPRVSEQDAEIFYWQHIERFKVPETREARHILVTINDTLAGNHRDEARARIESIAAQLAAQPERFADLALQYSECPTALQGGELGWVKEGQLYPELDTTLFGMAAGQISATLESPLGFHVLQCTDIRPAETKPFDEIKQKLLASLQEQRERRQQKSWLRGLS